MDCFYYSTMVLTTIGYGDLAPITPAGKLATCAFALCAVALIASQVEQMILLLAEHRLVNATKQHFFGDVSTSKDRLDASSMLAWKRVRLRMLGWLCFVLIGIVFLVGHLVLGLADWRDSVYFAVVTVTTVGFGDIAPKTPLARLCVAMLTLLLVPLFALFLGIYVDLQRGLTVAEGLTGIREQLTFSRLATLAAFRHEVCAGGRLSTSVSREDFLVFMVVRNDIVSKDTVNMIWDDFAKLDADGNGVLDPDELAKLSDHNMLDWHI